MLGRIKLSILTSNFRTNCPTFTAEARVRVPSGAANDLNNLERPLPWLFYLLTAIDRRQQVTIDHVFYDASKDIVDQRKRDPIDKLGNTLSVLDQR
jgi:hypothetical protein